MKQYITNPITIIGIIATIIFCAIQYNNDYMEFKDRKCTVLDKVQTPGGYKTPGRFYLVLRDERGIVFDMPVAVSTYSQAIKGSTMYFNVRQLEIKQSSSENLIYFVGPVVMASCAIVCFIFGFFTSRFNT